MGFDRRNLRPVPRVVDREEVIEKVEKENKVEEVAKKEEIVEINIEDIIETPPTRVDEDETVEEEVKTFNGIEVTEDMVICIDTGEIYADNKEASEKTGVNATSIKKCCNGNCKTAGKMVWKYIKDLD